MPMGFRWLTTPDLDLTIEVERDSDGLMLDFAGATASGATLDVAACTFGATPAQPTATFPQTAGGSGIYKIKFTNTSPSAFTDGDYFATVRTSAGFPLLIIPDAMFGGTDASQAPNAVSITTQDKADISTQVVAGINTDGVTVGGFADGVTVPASVQQGDVDSIAAAARDAMLAHAIGAGTYAEAMEAVAAVAWSRLETNQGVNSAIYAFKTTNTVRLTSVNGVGIRTVTYHP